MPRRHLTTGNRLHLVSSYCLLLSCSCNCSAQGEDVLLDIPQAVAMADGDGLQLEDGRWLKVQAAAEVVVEVRHKDPNQLVRLAWHLGIRHLPTEIRNDALRILPDRMIERMLLGFGADLATVQAAFQADREKAAELRMKVLADYERLVAKNVNP